MINCSRCGAELFDFFHGDIFHSHRGDKEHFDLCPACKGKLDIFLTEKQTKIETETYTLSFDLPDGYKVIKGDEDY